MRWVIGLLLLFIMSLLPIPVEAEITGENDLLLTQADIISLPYNASYVDYTLTDTGPIITYTVDNRTVLVVYPESGIYVTVQVGENYIVDDPVIIQHNGKDILILQAYSTGLVVYLVELSTTPRTYKIDLSSTVTTFEKPLLTIINETTLQLVYKGFSLHINLDTYTGKLYDKAVSYTAGKYFVPDGNYLDIYDANWNYIKTLNVSTYSGDPDIVNAAMEYKGWIYLWRGNGGYLLRGPFTNLYMYYNGIVALRDYLLSEYLYVNGLERAKLDLINDDFKILRSSSIGGTLYLPVDTIPSNVWDLLYTVSNPVVAYPVIYENSYYVINNSTIYKLPLSLTKSYIVPELGTLNIWYNDNIRLNYTLFMIDKYGYFPVLIINEESRTYTLPTATSITLSPADTEIQISTGLVSINTSDILILSPIYVLRYNGVVGSAGIELTPASAHMVSVLISPDYNIITTLNGSEKWSVPYSSITPNSTMFYSVNFISYNSSYYPIGFDVFFYFVTEIGGVVGLNTGTINATWVDDNTIRITLQDMFTKGPIGDPIAEVPNLVLVVPIPEDRSVKQVLVNGAPTDLYTIVNSTLIVDPPPVTIEILLSSSGVALGGPASSLSIYWLVAGSITLLLGALAYSLRANNKIRV